MISIVVPAYNEEENIKNVLRDIKDTIQDSEQKFEIIVVDDGSTDKTAEIVSSDKDVKIVRHPYNKGYGASLKTGARVAQGDFILYIDADNQHNPQDILKLIRHTDKYEMVIGARTKKSKTSMLRWLGRGILSLIANYLAGMKIPDLNSGFRVIRRDIIMEFMPILPNTFSFTTTITLLAIKAGYNIKYIPIDTTERIGTSKIKPFSDGFRFVMLILRTIMLFSPLKIFLPVSVVLFIIGLFWLLYEGILFLNIGDVPILFIISSIIVFLFGLLADQISLMRKNIGKDY